MTKSVNLKIVGDYKMHCAGCNTSVEFNLKMLPGVGEVKADADTQEIKVELTSGETGIEQLITSLAMIGYQTVVA